MINDELVEASLPREEPASGEESTNSNCNNNISEEASSGAEDPESDAHLPRVRAELDRLNYANESINNLELELEESKREFLNTYRDSDAQLASLEKKLGGSVAKSVPYYETRMQLNSAKQKYLNAKIRFETAQELYVAAKNMQMYAEENLESYDSRPPQHGDEMATSTKETLAKMLQVAKVKVNETELSKQSSDLEQIEAFGAYDEKLKQIELVEKNLKKHVEKSRKYYELKANLNKELKFLYAKVEGLKSCLKEAKLAYQQSLKNLENISTEVHAQRKLNNSNADETPSQHKPISPDTSSSTLSSASSSSISSPKEAKVTSLTESSVNSTFNEDVDERSHSDEEAEPDEDFDKYFAEAAVASHSETRQHHFKSNIQYSQKLAKHGVSLLSDEEVENLGLDEMLRKYEAELSNRKRTEENCTAGRPTPSGSATGATTTTTPNRPQFRVPALIALSIMSKK